MTVVICAYTMDRWQLTVHAVESVRQQTVQPAEVVLVIDNNDELLARARDHWCETDEPKVQVLPNSATKHLAGRQFHASTHGELRRFGAGTARNTGLAKVETTLVAFLDDDAHAEPDWLEKLIATYSAGVVAVGGAPLPDFAVPRPRWFPLCFDWIFGCAYFGMPEVAQPYVRLIGANMSTRTAELKSIGGFTGSDFDDLDICTRLEAEHGTASVIYQPKAVVHHYVSAQRLQPRYFVRRSFAVNREKVRVHKRMGSQRPLAAELGFVRSLRRYVISEVRALLRGDQWAGARVAMTFVGLALAGAGNVVGQWRYNLSPAPRRAD